MTPNMVLFVFICILLFLCVQISAGPFGEWLLWPRLWPVLSTSAPLQYVCRQHLQCQQSARGRNTVFPDHMCRDFLLPLTVFSQAAFFFFHVIRLQLSKWKFVIYLFIHIWFILLISMDGFFFFLQLTKHRRGKQSRHLVMVGPLRMSLAGLEGSFSAKEFANSSHKCKYIDYYINTKLR